MEQLSRCSSVRAGDAAAGAYCCWALRRQPEHALRARALDLQKAELASMSLTASSIIWLAICRPCEDAPVVRCRLRPISYRAKRLPAAASRFPHGASCASTSVIDAPARKQPAPAARGNAVTMETPHRTITPLLRRSSGHICGITADAVLSPSAHTT